MMSPLSEDFLKRVTGYLMEAGDLILGMREEASQNLHYKDHGEIVTIADIAVQAFLKEKLHVLLPSAGFVAEEGNALGEFERSVVQARTVDWTWVIDPIDGTSSYTSGLDTYGIQLALAYKGELVGGWIHCPSLGKTVAGSKSGYRLESGMVVDTRRNVNFLSEIIMVLASGDFDPAHKERSVCYAQLTEDFRGTRSCAVDYIEMLEGKRDMLVYRRTYPWDHAPGIFLIMQKGGTATRFNGSPYVPFDGGEGLIVSRNVSVLPFTSYFSR